MARSVSPPSLHAYSTDRPPAPLWLKRQLLPPPQPRQVGNLGLEKESRVCWSLSCSVSSSAGW